MLPELRDEGVAQHLRRIPFADHRHALLNEFLVIAGPLNPLAWCFVQKLQHFLRSNIEFRGWAPVLHCSEHDVLLEHDIIFRLDCKATADWS